MPAARSPSFEIPHAVGALMDTAFVRSAVTDATEPAGPRPPAPPSAWRRAWRRVRAALARLAPPA